MEGLTLKKAKCVFGFKTVQMLGHIVGVGSKRPDTSRIKTIMVFFSTEISSAVETSSWILCVQRKVGCRLLKYGCSSSRSTEKIGLSSQSRISTGYRNSQEGSGLRCTLTSPGQKSPSFSKPTHPEPVSERHSVRAKNLSAS